MGRFGVPLKHVFQWCLEYLGDAEGSLQRRGVFAGFDGGDGLAGHADGLGQIALTHLAVLKPQAADLIGDRWAVHGLKLRAGT